MEGSGYDPGTQWTLDFSLVRMGRSESGVRSQFHPSRGPAGMVFIDTPSGCARQLGSVPVM